MIDRQSLTGGAGLKAVTSQISHGAKMETTQGTYPIVVWALVEGDDASREVMGFAGAGGEALISPDPGTFERYTQTG